MNLLHYYICIFCIKYLFYRQRSLAEIAEMIHTADLIHRGVADLKENISDNNYLEDMQFGNKIAVLSGDYVLASASKALAQLHNASVSVFCW